MSVVTVLICQHCGATLPPDAQPCDGSALEPGEAYAVEQIEWRSDDGEPVSSRLPKRCVERWRGDDGKVRWPSAA